MKIYSNYLFHVYILFTLILFSCGDNVKIKREDLEKYPWMKTFTYGMINFKGLYHNVDLGNFSFSFKSKYHINDFFNKVDSSATKEGWKIIKRSDNLRIYLRPSKIYDAQNNSDKIILNYETSSNNIIFEFEISKSK